LTNTNLKVGKAVVEENMPPVQEQLLLTDTQQTGHQGVQGLRRREQRLQDD
jgi:hypothetical protein